MRIMTILALSLLASVSGLCQDILMKPMSEDIKSSSNVVVRNSSLEFEIISPGKAIETRKQTITILNEYGSRETQQVVPYSDNEKILSIKGEIYSNSGKRIKKIKSSEMEDVSASGSSMYSDNRYKVLDFSYPSYPYTLVFEYEIQHDGLMFYPSWQPQDHEKTAVQKASYTVTTPAELKVNHWEHLVEVTIQEHDGSTHYNWEVENLVGYRREPFGPPARELTPWVWVTPDSFEIEGHVGSMSSWSSIGSYNYSLLAGRDVLPDGARREIEAATRGLTDPEELIEAVYKFVQNSTRYVSVQLGIGGWQPFDAAYVYENGYGDCKALTNYTMALLKHVGVDATYSIVYAGRSSPDIITDFPNARFNHVILAAPIQNDTIWLECTSQTNPVGYTGSFTSDRHVLMVTEEGGKLAKTPTYKAEDNTQLRSIEAKIDKNGDVSATVATTYTGLQFEQIERQLYASKDEQIKFLSEETDLRKTKIVDFSYDYVGGKIPEVNETISVISFGYGSVTGNRIFIEANPLNKRTYIPRNVKQRKTDVYINTSYLDVDSVLFQVPEGYHVEHFPSGIEIKNNFGVYQTTFEASEHGILYIRKMILNKGIHPADSYAELRNMFKQIAKADKTKIVLVGST